MGKKKGTRTLARELLRDIITFTNALTVNKKGFDDLRLPVGKTCFRILCIVKDLEIHTIAGIREITGISASTVSIHMSRLVNDGHLEIVRPKGGEDGRKKFFYITEKGRLVVEAFRQMVLNDFAEIYIRLSEEKRVYLYQGIVKMHHVFDTMNKRMEDEADAKN